jgi:3-deoxy-D-manno-octulosonic-acid transferase
VRRSLTNVPAWKGEPPPVVLVDTMGELSAVWGLADVAFVGGAWSPAEAGRT